MQGALCDLASCVYHGRMYNSMTKMWKHISKDSTYGRAELVLHSEDMTMKPLTHILGMWGAVPLLGLVLLAQPQMAEARVEVNVGLDVPAPVVVTPAPVVVHRGHYRYYHHRPYYRRYYPGSYYRYPQGHWHQHPHYWHRW